MMGDWISFTIGLALMGMSYLVFMAYRPRRWNEAGGAGYLARAIAVAFLAAGLNTAYWQVFGQLGVQFGWVTVEWLRIWGDWVDLIVKGLAVYAGWLHLKALHEALPDHEKRGWDVLEMAFYPRRRFCLRLMKRVLNRKDEE